MIAALARPAVARLVRTPRAWTFAGAWCAVGVAFAIATRARGVTDGADEVLPGAYGALVLPLLAYGIVGAVLGSRSLSQSVAPLVSFGAPPATATAVTLALAMVASGLANALLATTIAFVAHGSTDPPVVRDAFESAYAGALGGVAYAAWLSLGASFGRRGGGRTAFLVLDWLLASIGGSAATIAPRAHVRNLLGGPSELDGSGHASAFALIVIAMACALLALFRTRNRSSPVG